MSRIALNARLLIPGKLEGTGRFTLQCYKRLIESRPDDQFLLIFDRVPPSEFAWGDNVETCHLLPPARRPWLFDLWYDYSLTWKLKSWKADLFVSTDGYISRRTNVPQLNVIHDINFEHNPEWLPKRYANHFRNRFPEYARLATKLCTVSEYSRQDIAKTYGVDPDSISIIPNAPSEDFKPSENKSSESPYIVFVGSLHPRKNVPGMVKAFEQYRKLGGTYELLIVGENMWRDERYQANGVRYSGRLNDEKLVEAISNAEAMLYLPFFEGFGVPIVEAMACGVPVVASNCTSVPEVCGSAAAALVDPNDFESAAEALLKLENDADWNRSRKEAGLKRAGDFSWDKSASILNDEIKKLLNG